MDDPALHAELAVLGACMTSTQALTDCAPLLDGTDFATHAHEVVWDAITALHTEGRGVDPITVAAHMTQAGTLNRAGGHLHLHDLVASVTTTTNAAWHARIVREAATRRRLVATGTRIAQLATTGERPAADLTAMAQAELAAAYRPDPSAAKTSIGDLLDDAIDAIETDTTTGIPWPWADARDVLNPATPGQFILIAARPSVGKSVACVDIARGALHRGVTTVVHTLEMSATEIIHRILAAEARVPLNNIQHNTLTPDEWSRIAKARADLADAPLHIVDTPAVGFADLAASITRFRPGMLIVDHLGLVSLNPKVDPRQGLEELSKALKILAKSAGIPIVAASQLNRGPEQRHDRVPLLSDLRNSGSLEQDADVVVLLHRPDQYEPEHHRAGEIDLIVAKQRNGPTQTVVLAHQLHYARFVDLAA